MYLGCLQLSNLLIWTTMTFNQGKSWRQNSGLVLFAFLQVAKTSLSVLMIHRMEPSAPFITVCSLWMGQILPSSLSRSLIPWLLFWVLYLVVRTRSKASPATVHLATSLNPKLHVPTFLKLKCIYFVCLCHDSRHKGLRGQVSGIISFPVCGPPESNAGCQLVASAFTPWTLNCFSCLHASKKSN